MRRLITIFITTSALLVGVVAQDLPTAKDSIVQDSLIFSEVMFKPQGGNFWGFVELFNASSDTIDLSNYFIQTNNASAITATNNIYNRWKLPLDGLLAPGKTYLIVSSQVNSAIDGWGKPLFPDGYFNIYAAKLADRMVGNSDQALDQPGSRLHSSVRAQLFYKRKVVGDSVMVDKFGWDQNGDYLVGGIYTEFIAGRITNGDPATALGYIRKTKIRHGNTIWDNSRSDDLRTSEWLPYENSTFNRTAWPYTTLGKHEPISDVGLQSTIASIDKESGTITLPYGVRRDSVFRTFTYNPNVTWEFKFGTDTAKYFMQTGDTLIFYAYGDSIVTEKYGIIVSSKPQNFEKVSPLVYKNAGGNFVSKYSVSEGYPIDTIGNVPFNERIDTLEKYLVFEEGSTYKFLLKNNENRVDLTDGDMVEVTAADGTSKKTYKISVLPFLPNHNALLNNVIMPGFELWEDPVTFMYSDTMKIFKSNGLFYTVTLPPGTKASPPILGIPQSDRAKVEVIRAKNLQGSEQERTASIKVTAEDDTTIVEYKILFTVDRPAPPLVAEPFFTDFSGNWGNRTWWVWQIFNPNDVTLDLGNYMIVFLSARSMTQIRANLAIDTITRDNFRPGYNVVNKGQGRPGFEIDYSQKIGRERLGPKEVYSMSIAEQSFPNTMGNADALEKIDFNGKLINRSVLRAGFGRGRINAQAGQSLAMYKILSDSVKDGLKAPWDLDNDFELVEILNGFSEYGTPWVMYDKIDGKDSVLRFSQYPEFFCLYRKPSVYTGNPVPTASFGSGTDSEVVKESEWVVYGMNPDLTANNNLSRAVRDARFENHTMVTAVNIPYIISSFYLVEDGYEGVKAIEGVTAGSTVNDFMANINKPDPNMLVVVTDASGNPKTGTEIMTTGDKVKSTSADGNTSVDYVVSVGALSNNALLTSTKYTVAKTGETGKVSGIVFGTSVEDLLADITVPDGAILSVTNGGDVIIPLQTATQDTTISWMERVPTTANAGIYLEVLAQNGIDKCLYSLEFTASDLTLLSDVYVVNQTDKIIDMITWTSVQTFKSNVYVNNEGSVKIIDKAGNERTKGTIMFDDKVIVTSKDGNTVISYWMKFRNEEGGPIGPESIRKNFASVDVAYPNPTKGVFTIQAKNTISSVKVFNIAGVNVKTIPANRATIDIDLGSFTNGIYLISVTDIKGQTEMVKVVKE